MSKEDGGRTGTGHINVEDPRQCQCVDCQIKVAKMKAQSPDSLYSGSYRFMVGDREVSIRWEELSGTY